MQREAAGKAAEAERKPESRSAIRPQRSTVQSPHPILQLQQAVGNRAVGRFLQAKLLVSQPGDTYEQEADRVADEVLRMPDPVGPGGPPASREAQSQGIRIAGLKSMPRTEAPVVRVFRNGDESEGEDARVLGKEKASSAPIVSTSAEDGFSALRGGGEPLSHNSRHFFESRFQRDFSAVRIHTGAQAEKSARSVNASAYTVGPDIVFGASQNVPGSDAGMRLLAHELTHVVQQGYSRPRSLIPGHPVMARTEGQAALSRTHVSGRAYAQISAPDLSLHSASPGVIQRMPDGNKPPDEQTTNLPAGIQLDQAMTRLESPEMVWLRKNFPPVDGVWQQLIIDSTTIDAKESTLRGQAARLNSTILRVAPAIIALQSMAKKEVYLPGVATTILNRVLLIAGMYAAAVVSAYSSLLIERDLLADADKELGALPDFITQQYLGPDGISRIIGQLHWTIETLKSLREASNITLERASNDPLDEPQLDDILRLSEPGGRRQELLTKWLFRDLELARKATTKQDAGARIEALSHQLSAYGTLAHAAVLHAQFAYWKYLLDQHPVLDHFPPRRETCNQYMKKLDDIISTLELGWHTSTTPVGAGITLDAGNTELQVMIHSPEFQAAVTDIGERLKTIATINVIGKVVLVTAGSMLVAGVAAAGVAASLETAGATTLVVGGGELVTQALAFTAASRLGQEIAFGQVEGTFLGDFVTNLAMIGALKGATAAFGKVFKAFADPKVYMLSYAVGKAGVGLATVQMFSEAQHALLTGKSMTGEERYRAAIQNVITFACLEAAGFITKPIQERIGVQIAQVFGLDKRFSADLVALQSKQADLRTTFEGLKRSTTPDPAKVEELLKGTQDLWGRELALLERGMQRHAINQDQYNSAIRNYNAASARLELQLANLGVTAPGGPGKVSFRRVGEGVVSFAAGSQSIIEEFYRDKGGTFKPAEEGGFEGRLPTGEVTFYIRDTEVPTSVPSNEAIAKARDAAQRAADADPLVQQGLSNLNRLMGARKADAVLANAKDVTALLLALADPGFPRQWGAAFYLRLAAEPAAISFVRAYGAELFRNLQSQFGWEHLGDVLTRATSALEGAATAEARKTLASDLAATKDAAKIEALLGTPIPPKPPKPRPPTKKSMGVDRARASWDVFRREERKFAESHGETLTDEQLDIRADLRQVVASAETGQFRKLGHKSRLSILDRFDALAKESGMLQTWINQARGDLAEALFNPSYQRSKPIFLNRVRVSAIVEGVTVPDYEIAHTGFSEWVNQKSDLIDQGPRQKSGVYDAAVQAASRYLKRIRERDILNIPSGDKVSLDFIRDPGPGTRQRMLDILHAPGSPVYRVRFGEGPWMENPNP
jgi:hypothetical protein